MQELKQEHVLAFPWVSVRVLLMQQADKFINYQTPFSIMLNNMKCIVFALKIRINYAHQYVGVYIYCPSV
jgi:hypothetical protein